MLYTWKVRALKSPALNYWWRYWRAWRGRKVGNYDQLPQHIRNSPRVVRSSMSDVCGASMVNTRSRPRRQAQPP
jgi:hypothetical protein